MKKISNLKKRVSEMCIGALALIAIISVTSCDPTIDALAFDLPDANSKEDLTPPTASFKASVTIDYLTYTFSNISSSATDYVWNYGDGNTSTGVDGINTFPAEGIYTVTLTAKDKLGKTSTFSLDIEVVEPESPPVPDPVLLNAEFVRLNKSSGSDCTCSGWINKSIGDQGESSTGNGSDVVKYDNLEPDAIYQEFAVTPNANYTIKIISSFSSSTSGSYPSMLELRILAGSGYVSGYSPTYYTDTTLIPQDDFGYTTISQVETAANNLLVKVESNPGNSNYNTYEYTFNVGANDSVALFVRGIGGPATGGAGGDFGYNSGDEEIRTDSITITAIN